MWARILASIGLDATDFEAGAKRVDSAVTRMGRNLSGHLKGAIAGAFSVGAISGFTKMTIDAANRIQDLADQFELTTDQVQELDFAAKQVGSSFEDIGGKIDKMGKARADANAGDQKAIAIFQRLGIEAERLSDPLTTNLDLFLQISKAYESLGAKRSDLMELFGKGGGQLASVLQSLNENKGQGVFFSAQDIAAIDKLTELYEKSKSQAGGKLANAAISTLRGERLTGFGPIDKIIYGLLEKVGPDPRFETPITFKGLPETEDEKRARQVGELIAQNAANPFPGQAAENARLAALDPMKLFAPSASASILGGNGIGGSSASDALARVGGFVGGAGSYDPSLTIATESFRVLQSIDRHLQEIKASNAGPGGNLNNQFTQ